MNLIAALIQAVLSIFFKPKTPDPAIQTAQVANAEASISATTARQTQVETQKELSNVQAQTDADVARVQSARSVSDERAALEDAIRSANQAPGAN